MLKFVYTYTYIIVHIHMYITAYVHMQLIHVSELSLQMDSIC